MKLNNRPAPLRDSLPIKPLKTPAAQRAHARNWHRRKKGKPESLVELPLHARSDVNRPRRGSGNVDYYVAMTPKAWEILDGLKAGRSRGEYLELLIRENEIHRMETGTLP